MKNRKLKIFIAVIVLLAIIAATAIPIVTQWGGAFYTPAAEEAIDVTIKTQRILKMDKYQIDESFRDQLIELLKE